MSSVRTGVLAPEYYGSGEPAASRRQSLLREQARCALLPAATPRLRTSWRVLRRAVAGCVPPEYVRPAFASFAFQASIDFVATDRPR
jgi:hypothetical protein